MYGMIKFPDWEVRKETKYSKLSYYYKDKRIEEKELKIDIPTGKPAGMSKLKRSSNIK